MEKSNFKAQIIVYRRKNRKKETKETILQKIAWQKQKNQK